MSDDDGISQERVELLKHSFGRISGGDIDGAESVHKDALCGNLHTRIHHAVELLTQSDPPTIHRECPNGEQPIGSPIERSQLGIDDDKTKGMQRRILGNWSPLQ
jgi:hypothetical protein